MAYTILFFGLLIAGVQLYRQLLHDMSAAAIIESPRVPLFFIFAAYGAVVLFILSECFRVWSGMHSLTLVGLVIVGMPWLLVQGFIWRHTWAVSAYHRATIALSFAFPGALALLVAFAFVFKQ